MTMARLAGVLALLTVAGLNAAPAGPYPNPWRWDALTTPPTLSLDLGVPAFSQTFTLPPGAQELLLVLNKYLMTEPGVVLEWKTDAAPGDSPSWFWRQKKIPGEASTELVPLPPGRLITLQVRSRSGTRLADITLQRK